MINMIVLAYFDMAIVALAFLSIILHLYILFGVSSWAALLEGAAFVVFRFYLFGVSSIIQPSILTQIFPVVFSPTSLQFMYTFSIFLLIGTSLASSIQATKFFIKVFSGGREQLFAEGTASKAMWNFLSRRATFCIPLTLISSSAYLAPRSNTIGISRVWPKVLSSSRLDFLAITATLISIWKNFTWMLLSASVFSHSTTTCLTVDFQSARRLLRGMKKIKRSREPSFALRALLQGKIRGYNIRHSCHPSNQGGSLEVWGASNASYLDLFPHYSITPLLKQDEEVCYA